MKNIIRFFALHCLFIFSILHLACVATPTERHLDRHPLEKIVASMNQKYHPHIPLLLEIASYETEETFFGYHATTDKTRIYQDILRAVFEEILHVDLPENFYFLRIPGEPMWEWRNGIKDFLEHFENCQVKEENRNLIMSNLLAYLNTTHGVKLVLEDFTPDELATIWNHFQYYLKKERQSTWISQAKKYALPKDFMWPILEKNINLEATVEVIRQRLEKKHPEIDHQVVTKWLGEILTDEFEMTFLPLSLRHLDLDFECKSNHYKLIEAFITPFDDTTSPHQNMLVSMNIPIFGNHDTSGCFTAKIFLQNQSVLGGDKKLIQVLDLKSRNL